MSNSKNSSTDDSRETMKWNEEAENYLYDIKKDCYYKIKILEKKIKKYKKLYYIVNFPIVIIPILIPIINPILGFLFISISSGCISALSAINIWIKIERKIEQFKTFQNKYYDLNNKIDVLLLKNKKYRPAVEITIEQIKNLYENINNDFNNL